MTLKTGICGVAMTLVLSACGSNSVQGPTEGPAEVNCSTIADTYDREFCYEQQRMDYLDRVQQQSREAEKSAE